MSSQRACNIVKWTDGNFYCIVARDEHDYDFRNFSIFGPADTVDNAFDKMDGCNPGGFTVIRCKKQKDLYDERLRKALKKYIKNGYRMPKFEIRANTIRRKW